MPSAPRRNPRGKSGGPPPTLVELNEGRIFINGIHFSLDSHEVERPLGDGANGIVFKARNLFLKRDEAIKIWLVRREGDVRNKLEQGVLEAQRQAAEKSDKVVKIFHAGVKNNYFYVTMQFYDAQNLRNWLKQDVSLLQRWKIARGYYDLIKNTTSPELYHGDPHDKNVLITQPTVEGIRLCDYGTSLYMGRIASYERHWAVVDETFERILRKFHSYAARKQYHQNRWREPFSVKTTMNIHLYILVGLASELWQRYGSGFGSEARPQARELFSFIDNAQVFAPSREKIGFKRESSPMKRSTE
jgi:serine/threonine protein kinase